VTLAGLGSAPALAHAVLVQSLPASGAMAPEAPSAVELRFSEPPAGRSTIVVTDGCRRDVAEEVTVAGRVVTVAVASGQPGAWSVRYSVLSDVDGHASQGEVSFGVAGAAACGETPGSSTRQEAVPPPAEAAPGSSPGVPVPVLAGVAALVLLGAVLARRAIR
jgi:copper resistance protein C